MRYVLPTLVIISLLSQAYSQNQDIPSEGEEAKPSQAALPVSIYKMGSYKGRALESSNQLKTLPQQAASLPYSNDTKTNSSNEVQLIDYEKIKTLIFDTKKELCKVNQTGSYEIYLSFSPSGEVSVSTGNPTGFKAVLNCP
jgi:hypothetical protein